MRQLEKDLKRVTEERDILKKLWPSSQGHHNEILFFGEPPLSLFGGELEPCFPGQGRASMMPSKGEVNRKGKEPIENSLWLSKESLKRVREPWESQNYSFPQEKMLWVQ